MNNIRILKILTMCVSVIIGTALFTISEPVTVYAQSDKTIDLPTGDIVNPRARKGEIHIDDISPEEFSEIGGNTPRLRAKFSLNNSYYYNQLTDSDKLYYNAILQASVKNIGAYEKFSEENSVLIYKGNSSLELPNWTEILNALEYDHPEQLESIMYVVQIQTRRSTSNGVSYYAYYAYFKPGADCTGEKLKQMESDLQSNLDSFYAGLTLTGDDANKELIIHDALVDAVEYDYECADNYLAFDVAHTAYGALVDRSAVCDGYSKAFKMLLNKAGIDSEVVAGLGNGGGHAWNVVKIGSSWYETDVTWDDQSDYSDNKYYFKLSHEYFNLTTADITRHLEDTPGFGARTTTHVRDYDYLGYLNPPVADGLEKSYSNIKQVYKITYNGTLDGANIYPSSSYTYEGKVLDIPSYKYLYGYSFDNWYSEKTGGSIVSFDTAFKKATTVYARWIPNDVKVNLSTGIGNIETITLKYGEVYSNKLPDNMEKEGFFFAGWYFDSEYKDKVESDTKVSKEYSHNLYARWLPNGEHNIVFNANGGKVDTESTVLTGGEKFGSLPTPTRYGYSFGGWYDASEDGNKITADTIVVEDIELYAHWTPVTVRVYFYKNDGYSTYRRESVNYDGTYGQVLSNLNNYTWDGHTFIGWFTEPEGGEQIYADTRVTIAEQHSLYAHWSVNQYTITFNANGGKVDTESTVLSGVEKIGELPTPTRYGYTFDGWYDASEGGKKIISGTTVAEDSELYAHWKPATVKVHFYQNDGSVIYQWKSVYYDGTYEVALSNLVNIDWDGYTFIGWFTAPNGGEQIYADTRVTTVEQQNLYAHWEKNASEELSGSDQKDNEVVQNETQPASGGQSAGNRDESTPDQSNQGSLDDHVRDDSVNDDSDKSKTDKSGSGNIGTIAKTSSGNTNSTAGNNITAASSESTNGESANSTTSDSTTKPGSVSTNSTTGNNTAKASSVKTGSVVVVNGATYVVTGKNEADYKGIKSGNAKTVTIPATIKIKGETYKVTGISSKAFRKKTKLRKVTIGKNVTRIGSQAFEGCTALTTVNGGSSVRTIGAKAYNGCKKLKKAPIGSKVTSIGNMAFYNCSALTNMTIPANVDKLGKQFAGKTPKLKTLTVKTKKLNTKGITNKAFTGMGNNKTVTKVPKGKAKAYKSLFQKKGLNKKIKVR